MAVSDWDCDGAEHPRCSHPIPANCSCSTRGPTSTRQRQPDCCRPCGARSRCQVVTEVRRAHRRRRVGRPRSRGRRMSSPGGAASRALQLSPACARGRPAVADAGFTPAAGWLLPRRHRALARRPGATRGRVRWLRGLALLAAVYTTAIGAIGLLAAVVKLDARDDHRPADAPVAPTAHRSRRCVHLRDRQSLPAARPRSRTDRHRVRRCGSRGTCRPMPGRLP